jgi:hypothetical protein
MPISVTERKKAEELIRSKFKTLSDALAREVDGKRGELNGLWAKKIGLDRLTKQHQELRERISKLEAQIEEMTDGYNCRGSSYSYVVPKASGKLSAALKRLETAHNEAKTKMDEQRNSILEKLWFGLLSSDALALLDGIPTMTQLKANGLSLLQLPATKLLDAGR